VADGRKRPVSDVHELVDLVLLLSLLIVGRDGSEHCTAVLKDYVAGSIVLNADLKLIYHFFSKRQSLHCHLESQHPGNIS